MVSVCACVLRGMAKLLDAACTPRSCVPVWYFEKHLWSFLGKTVATRGPCQIRSTRAVVIILPLQVMAEVMRMSFISVSCRAQGALCREMCQLGMNQKNMRRHCHLLPGPEVTSVAQPMDLSITFQIEMYVKKNPFKYQNLEDRVIFASSEEAQI